MAKASRNKGGSARRNPRRDRSSLLWYGAAAVVVVAAVVAIVVSRDPSGGDVGPTPDDHWHAALGVYDCDTWVPDWTWPFTTSSGSPARAGADVYAGLHSHDDGLIHMEPATTDETGENATVGRYFEFGGWDLDATSVRFVNVDKRNGDQCGDAPGTLHWSVNGKEKTGNPADYKLLDGDVVAIAFLPDSEKLADIGDPPSKANLADPNAGEEGRAPVTTAAVGTTPAGTAPVETSPPATSAPTG